MEVRESEFVFMYAFTSFCNFLAVPEMVQNLVVSGESANMFRVNWRSPMIDNGAITTYAIVVTDYTSGAVVNRTNVTAVTNDDTNQYSQTATSQQLGTVRVQHELYSCIGLFYRARCSL